MSFAYGFNILCIAFMMRIGTLSHLLAGPGILSLALKSLGKDAKYKVGLLVSIKQEKTSMPLTPG